MVTGLSEMDHLPKASYFALPQKVDQPGLCFFPPKFYISILSTTSF